MKSGNTQKNTRRILLTIFTFLLAYSGIKAQVAGIELIRLSNPVAPNFVVPGGAAVPFTLKINNTTATTYNGAKLEVTIPSDWSYDRVTLPSPLAGSVTNTGNKYYIPLDIPANLTDLTAIAVEIYLTPACTASASTPRKVLYRLLDNSDNLLAEPKPQDVLDIANFAPSVWTITGSGPSYPYNLVDFTKTCSISQTANGSYIEGGKLQVNISWPYTFTISKLEVKTGPLTTDWTDITSYNLITSVKDTSYTVGITNAVLQLIGNHDGRLDYGETLEMRPTIQSTTCKFPFNVNMVFTGKDGCNTSHSFNSPITITDPTAAAITTTMISYPTGTNPKGLIHYKLENKSSGNMPLNNFTVAFGAGPANNVSITSFTPTDENWNVIGSACAISRQSLTTTYIGKVDVVTLGDIAGVVQNGILQGGKTYYANVEFELTNLDKNVCLSEIPDRYLYIEGIKTIICNGTTTNRLTSGGQNFKAIRYTKPVAQLENNNLKDGDETIMKIRCRNTIAGPNLLYNGVNHNFTFTLPANLLYNPAVGITDSLGVAIPAGRITYEDATNTLTISGIDIDIPYLEFNVGVKAKYITPMKEIDQKLVTGHSMDWGDGNNYRYSCYDVSCSYIVSGLSPSCPTIKFSSVGLERISLGFKSETDLTKYTLQEARDAGVNLQAAGPYDDIRFDMNLVVPGGANLVLEAGETFYVAMSYYAATSSNPYFTAGGTPATIVSGGNTFQTTVLPTFSVGTQDPETKYYLHTVSLDLSEYVHNGTISLADGSAFSVSFVLRLTEAACPNIPAYLMGAKSLVGIKSGGSERSGCWRYFNDLLLFDYKLKDMRGMLSVQNNQIRDDNRSAFFRFNLDNSNNEYISDDEVFVNEFRPALSLQTINSKDAIVIKSHGLYPYSYYEQGLPQLVAGNEISKTYYTVEHLSDGTRLLLDNQESDPVKTIYSGEYYNKYNDAFMVVSKFTYVCYDYYDKPLDASIGYTNYPTSASPKKETTTSTLCKFTGSASGFDSGIYYTSTPYSQTIQKEEAEWTYFLQRQMPENKVIPHVWFSVKTIQGNLKDLHLWIGDDVSKIQVDSETNPWVTAGDGSLWIKAPAGWSIRGGRHGYATLKAKPADCSVDVIKSTFSWGYSYVGFPQGGPTGNIVDQEGVDYKIPPCLTYSSDISLTNPHPTHEALLYTDALNTYDFCDPMMYDVQFSNSGEMEFKNLKIEVELPRMVNGEEVLGLVTNDPAHKIQYRIGLDGSPWTDFIVTADNVKKETRGEKRYLALYLPSNFVLKGYNTVTGGIRQDLIRLRFGMKPLCNYTDGKALSMNALTGNSCGGYVSQPLTSPAIVIKGLSEVLPTITIPEINGKTADETVIIPLKSISEDGAITFTGKYAYSGAASANIEAMIEIPDHLSLDAANSYLRKEGAGSNIPFVQDAGNPNQLIAMFDNEAGPLIYDFKVVLIPEAGAMDCSEKEIDITARSKFEMTCTPGNGENPYTCQVYRNITSRTAKFRMDKIEVTLEDVAFEEYYDAANGQQVKVSGKAKNNGDTDLSDFILELYSGDTKIKGISIPLIPAGDTEEFEIISAVSAAQICGIKLSAPRNETQNTYICSPLTEIPASIPYRLTGTYQVCQGDNNSVQIGDPVIEGYNYTWLIPDATSQATLKYMSEEAENNGIKSPVKFAYKSGTEGTLSGSKQTQGVRLIVRRNAEGTCNSEVSLNVYVVPEKSTWLGSINEDWNNTGNWSNGIPDKCTDVLIPDGKNVYPILRNASTESNYLQPACAKITFEHGGEVAKPFWLDYDEAEVRLNLAKNQWYMLSAPLRDMYSGDYFDKSSDPMHTSRPKVFMQQYQTVNPEDANLTPATLAGNWSNPFNTADVRLEAGSGFVAGINLDEGNGSFVFPSKHSSNGNYQNSTAYQNGETILQYPYFSSDGISHSGIWTGWGNIRRDHAARFIYEEKATEVSRTAEGKWYPEYTTYNSAFGLPVNGTNTNYNTFIVGNPFMSHLDFSTFRATLGNDLLIKNKYYLWNNAGGSFDAFNEEVSTFDSDNNRYIAPMQSFVLEKAVAGASVNQLKFNAAMSVTLPKQKLRNNRILKGINVEVRRNNQRNSAVTLIYNPEASNSYDENKDAYTLFNTKEQKPAIIYALTDKKATSIHTDNFTQPIELGVRTSEKGFLTFSIKGVESLGEDKKLLLEDRYMNIFHHLNKEPEYLFSNATGNIEGRFFLHLVSESQTNIEEPTEAVIIRIYAYKELVYISSSASDLIRSVEISDIQGRSLIKEYGIDSDKISYPVPAGQRFIVVKVLTGKTCRIEKIVNR